MLVQLSFARDLYSFISTRSVPSAMFAASAVDAGSGSGEGEGGRVGAVGL